jgi:hypothetical protein
MNDFQSRVVALAALVGAAFVADGAWAQPAPEQDPERRAAALFDRGVEAQRLGRSSEACEQFAASAELHPTPHALLQLGNCSEPADLVQALAHFQAALSISAQVADAAQRQAYEEAARERVTRLVARIPTLAIRPAPGPDVRVELVARGDVTGDRVISVAEGWHAPRGLNPGRYVLRFARVGTGAPEGAAYAQTIELTEGSHVEVSPPTLPAAEPTLPINPPLGTEVTAGPGTRPSPPTEANERELRFEPLPIAFAGAGVLLVATSLVTGRVSSTARSKLDGECDPPDRETGLRSCDPSLSGTKARVDDYALLTDLLWGAGAISAGVGITLFILDQRDRPPAQLDAACSPAGCAISLAGGF